MFFDSFHDVFRVIVIGVLAYAAVVTLLRISGKRTLAKMNAFDLVVTVALGSTLATILLSNSVALAEGVVGLALLVVLQIVVAWGASHYKAVGRLVKSEPRLLLHRGSLLEEALLQERIAPDEVAAAIRASGHADLARIDAVVLETDGSFSVIADAPAGACSALENVTGWRG